MRRLVIEDDDYDYDDCAMAMVAAMLHQLMNDDAQHDLEVWLELKRTLFVAGHEQGCLMVSNGCYRGDKNSRSIRCDHYQIARTSEAMLIDDNH